MKRLKVLAIFLVWPFFLWLCFAGYIFLESGDAVNQGVIKHGVVLTYWIFYIIGIPAVFILRKINRTSFKSLALYGAGLGLVLALALFGLPNSWVATRLIVALSVLGVVSGLALGWALNTKDSGVIH